MAKVKKKKPEDVVEDIAYEEVEVSQSTGVVIATETLKKESEGLIDHELLKFELQVKEIQDALETIKFDLILDVEDRLKAINSKIVALTKLGPLLTLLEDLRTKAKTKADQVKGGRDLSPLEDGSLE